MFCLLLYDYLFPHLMANKSLLLSPLSNRRFVMGKHINGPTAQSLRIRRLCDRSSSIH
jgi:hypothetical protein